MWCTIYYTYIHYGGEIWENKLLLHLSSRLVEWHRVAQQGVDDVRVVVERLVHHQGEDTIWAARPLFSSIESFLSMVSWSQPDALSWASSISSLRAA